MQARVPVLGATLTTLRVMISATVVSRAPVHDHERAHAVLRQQFQGTKHRVFGAHMPQGAVTLFDEFRDRLHAHSLF
jgi:hypothetical protein